MKKIIKKVGNPSGISKGHNSHNIEQARIYSSGGEGVINNSPQKKILVLGLIIILNFFSFSKYPSLRKVY